MARNRNLIPIRLKDVVYGEDFRRNERTIYEEFRSIRQKLAKFTGDPRANEAYCFVSCSGNQILWVLHVSSFDDLAGTRYACSRNGIVSVRYRIEGGTFSFSMLQHYANAVGFRLPDTFKSLREKIRERTAA